MAEYPDHLDARLDRLFGSVTLSPQFESRLMARVNAQSDVTEQVDRDYRTAIAAASRWRRRLLEFLTLDVAAAAGLLIFGEAMLLRVLQTLPPGVKGSAVWQLLAGGAMSGLLALIPIAAIAAILWPIFDYGRSPE
jgi:hypothetical protein